MGRIYAVRLACMGYNVVLVDINGAGLEETESVVIQSVTDSSAVPQNMKDELKVMRIVQDLSIPQAADIIYEKVGGDGCELEVLVNNAGIMYCQAIHATSERMLSLIMMVHMYTPWMLCRKFINGMRARGCGYMTRISPLSILPLSQATAPPDLATIR